MRHGRSLTVALLGISMVIPTGVFATTGDVSTYLGRVYDYYSKPALLTQFDRPEGIAVSRAGTVYVANTLDNVVQSFTPSNDPAFVGVLAGTGEIGRKDGAQVGAYPTATLYGPTDVAISGDRLFITDSGNGRVRVYRNFKVSTLLTGLRSPMALKVSGAALYISDTGNNRILKVSASTGRILKRYRIASPEKFVQLGSSLYVVNNGRTTVTALNLTNGKGRIVMGGLADAGGIANVNGRVVFSAGANGIYNELWQYDPVRRTAKRLVNRLETEWYNYVSDLEYANGKLYASFSRGSSIFTLDPDGSNPVRIAGEHRYGDRDGAIGNALLGRPKFLALSPDGGTLYLLENHKIKAFDLATQTLRLLAGHANDNYVEDTGGIEGRMSGTNQMALSPDGNTLYFADRNNNRIRLLDIPTATFHYLTGAGGKNAEATSSNGYREGGPCKAEFALKVAGCAYFSRPNGIAISKDGKTLYVADTGNHRIRSVDIATGRTRLLAGGGKRGHKDGVGGRALFNSPWTLLLSADGATLYVVDINNHAIRGIDLTTRSVTTLLGNGRAGYRNGSFASARLSLPEYLALGPNSNTLYLSEAGSNRVRVLDLSKRTIRLLAGSGARGSRNGTASNATFTALKGMLLLGNQLIVADQLNDELRSIVP